MTAAENLEAIRASTNNVYEALQAQIDYLASVIDSIPTDVAPTTSGRSAVSNARMTDLETRVTQLNVDIEDRLAGLEVRITNIETEDLEVVNAEEQDQADPL